MTSAKSDARAAGLRWVTDASPGIARRRCGKGFKAVPQLQISLTYDIPRDIQLKKQYKVDAFPQEKHNPLSDHDDFANVMSQKIMNRLVNCVNTGKKCRE